MAKIRNYTENNSWEMAGGKNSELNSKHCLGNGQRQKFRIILKAVLEKWLVAKVHNHTEDI